MTLQMQRSAGLEFRCFRRWHSCSWYVFNFIRFTELSYVRTFCIPSYIDTCVSVYLSQFPSLYGFIHIRFEVEYTYHFRAVTTDTNTGRRKCNIARSSSSITFVRLVEKFRDKQTPGNRSNKLTDVTKSLFESEGFRLPLDRILLPTR